MSEILDKQVGGDHYSKVEIQPIEYILANNLGFCRGNIIKYITRDKFKDKDKDIKKIIDYAAYILCNDYGYTVNDIKKYLKGKFEI